MENNKKIWNWIIPLLAIVFLALVMFKQAPETNKENTYYPPETEIDETQLAYSETGGFGLELETLSALAVDEQDRVYVVGDKKLLLLQPNGSTISVIDLNEPGKCITVGKDGKIYVGFRKHIGVFDSSGRKLAEWEKIDNDSFLTSLTLAGNLLFAADAGIRNVWKFDSTGKLLGKLVVQHNKAETKFIVPSPFFDVATAADGSIWVVNPGRHKLENFTVDGKLSSSWGESSPELEGFCGCCNPTNIAIMKDGSFVTSEKGYNRIKIYDPEGTFEEVVAGEDQFQKGTKGLDLAVNSQGKILVLDPKLKKIRIFIKK